MTSRHSMTSRIFHDLSPRLSLYTMLYSHTVALSSLMMSAVEIGKEREVRNLLAGRRPKAAAGWGMQPELDDSTISVALPTAT